MRRQISNLFKSYITTIFAIVVYILTSILIFKGTISFWPDAFAGYAIGSILLFSPRIFGGLYTKYINSKTDKS